MDSFLVDSDPVIPKDLGDMPKEQQKFDLIANDDDSHSRFMAAEKSDSSKKFPSEVTDLLGDSFAMSNPVPVPPPATAAHDNRDLFHEKDNFDDFFMKSVEEKKNPEPAAFAPSSLIDIGGEPDFFGAQKQPTASVVDDFEDADQADDLTKAKDTIESDYMNPYAEVRSNPAKKVEEPPLVAADPPAASTKDDDIFNDFSSHQAAKLDQFSEPMFDDSPPTPPIVIPKAAPAPAPAPAPEPVVITPATPKSADPPKEKPKPAPTPVVVAEQIQAEKIFKQFGLVTYSGTDIECCRPFPVSLFSGTCGRFISGKKVVTLSRSRDLHPETMNGLEGSKASNQLMICSVMNPWIICNLFYIKAQAKKKKGRGRRRDLNSNSREFAHHHCFIRERIVSGSACGKIRRRIISSGSSEDRCTENCSLLHDVVFAGRFEAAEGDRVQQGGITLRLLWPRIEIGSGLVNRSDRLITLFI
ncbi:reticulon/nogo [Culex quinquefasciatus]|uniref:Reticulon/nogo n=1 Tax=Culex quinquefasciatus TaxID=7176 RepID=B0WCF5_CULQU|nr:reticulon/nogo [Culex quinquefasciatus]|eukprot:XP_001846389.1 reticulon/nogo [Culex quinquefasciatus]